MKFQDGILISIPFKAYLLTAVSVCVGMSIPAKPTHLSSSAYRASAVSERLEEGKTFNRALKENEHHSYELLLSAGQYFHVRFNFHGLDAAVRLVAPDGTVV